MVSKIIIPNLISAITSIAFIALFIFLLPSILILLGALILLAIIAAIVLRFTIGKKSKMNFIYVKRSAYAEEQNTEETHEMKDVTNSSKSIE